MSLIPVPITKKKEKNIVSLWDRVSSCTMVYNILDHMKGTEAKRCNCLNQWWEEHWNSLSQWFSKCAPWTSKLSTTWKLVRNVLSSASGYWLGNSGGGVYILIYVTVGTKGALSHTKVEPLFYRTHNCRVQNMCSDCLLVIVTLILQK